LDQLHKPDEADKAFAAALTLKPDYDLAKVKYQEFMNPSKLK
jgi:hypothetical protein